MVKSKLALPEGTLFHHLGYATRGVEAELPMFESLGYVREGDSFSDPIQGISGCFIAGAGPRIELLENLPGSETLTPWLDKGVRIYHMAYVAAAFMQAIEWAKLNRAKLIVPPTPSVAFNGRNICFVMFRNGVLLEFIEAE